MGRKSTWSFSRLAAVAATAVIVASACDSKTVPSARPSNAEPSSPPAVASVVADQRLMGALATLKAASDTAPEVTFASGAVRSVRAHVAVSGADPVSRAIDFLSRNSALYGLRPGMELIVQSVTQPPNSTKTSVSFAERYRGVPVLGAGTTVVVDGSSAFGSGGALDPELNLDVIPAIDAAAAARFATEQVPGGSVRGDPQLVVIDPVLFGPVADPAIGNAARLAWKVRIASDAFEDVIVDALKPAVILRSVVDEADWDISVTSLGNETDAVEAFACALAAETFDLSDPETLIAQKLFSQTASWYQDKFHWDSWDGDDADIDVHINALLSATTAAHWVPACEMFEFGDGYILSGTTEGIDYVVHEFQHAVSGSFVDFPGTGMGGAMNEGISDAFATFMTGQKTIGPWNVFDPNVSDAPDHVDDMYTPLNPCGPQKPPPASCQDDLYGMDDGWEHWNATLISHPAYLMANGGTHKKTGIVVPAPTDADDLAEVFHEWFAALPKLGFANGNLGVLRWALEDSADVSGHHPQALCRVRNAFAAIGVGFADQDCNDVLDNFEDSDSDTVPDGVDNCPSVANPTQADLDEDEIGDACDPDIDDDGVPNAGGSGLPDNCPTIKNHDQADANLNGVGTACDGSEDGDIDNDLVPDGVDNCPFDYNPRPQPDVDGDGDGDACDPDHDGDGVSTNDDNCPDVANPEQLDRDRDGLGDDCDGCPNAPDRSVAWDATVITTASGETSVIYVAVTPDSDGDGTPDACDRDVAGDGATLRVDGDGGLRAPSDDPQRTDVVVSGVPGGEVSILIAMCDVVCTEPPDTNPCVEARISGAESTRVTIVDATGDVVARADSGGDGSLRYSPSGDTSYALKFERLASATGDERMGVELQPCVRGERTTGGTETPPPPTSPPIPTFGNGTATVDYSVGGTSRSLSGGRCAVAVLDGYAFSVSAGTLGTADVIAVSALQVSLPLGGSWAAVITGNLAGTPFATLSGVLTFDAGGASGSFQGTSPTSGEISGTFRCG